MRKRGWVTAASGVLLLADGLLACGLFYRFGYTTSEVLWALLVAQGGIYGLASGPFLLWLWLRHTSLTRAATREHEVLQGEVAPRMSSQQVAFKYPFAILPLTAVLLASGFNVFAVANVPGFLAEERLSWWLAPLIITRGVVSVTAVRASLRLIRLAYSASAEGARARRAA